ncbi:hypothetical protein [Pseudonocardia endophytica]|uniref:Gluconate 2-dehydrogenase subunit 3-like protein n=1 Tax=Pseudonocardia endophytica TaxID=401976 RepID=A0A4R1HQE9_PSEEN|nr:hypothetical protein [Pseudonocardia endophytica]TCK24797.1 hypothetical protein EV378_0590 [Pseudonocardia endophytica]
MTYLLSRQDHQTLTKVIYAAFPHRTFPQGPYQRAADAVVEQAATNPRMLAQLVQGIAELDTQRDVPFAELDVATAAAVLRGADGSPFVTSIVDSAIVTIYSDPEVWDLLGYEGPSFDKGGYVDRGFDDLDWLPDPQIEYEGQIQR